MLITHDLGVVAGVTQRIQVMYAGRIVETATTRELFAHPRHPYTVGLLRSIPRLDLGSHQALIPIDGLPPDMTRERAGCPFAQRLRLGDRAVSGRGSRARPGTGRQTHSLVWPERESPGSLLEPNDRRGSDP